MAPNGWTKWIILGYEYIYVECESDDTFSKAIKYLEDNAIPLVSNLSPSDRPGVETIRLLPCR